MEKPDKMTVKVLSSILSRFILIFAFLIFSLAVSSSPNQSNDKSDEKMVMVCGDSKVLIVTAGNSSDTIPEIVWEWDAHKANDLPELFRLKKFNSIDDCKAIEDGSKILISSSSGAVAMVDRETRKVMFYAEVPNAHSIEMLPGNIIVAAASTHLAGNRLMVFDLNQSGTITFTDSLYSAHGVVWDNQRNSLYALGYDVLREYKILHKNQLTLRNEWKIPGISGHDLQMAPDHKALFLTESTGAWTFNLNKYTFSKIPGFPDDENIKSIQQSKSGRFVYTLPEESWWTFHVRFHNPDGILAFPDIHVYKARWLRH